MASAPNSTPRLRPARPEDAAFARRLYFATNRWIVERLIGWDEARESERFASEFRPEEAQIILLDSVPIGWMQAGEAEGALQLKQICLDPAYQRRGIGTMLLQELIAAAEAKALPVELTVARINLAVGLYARLGFRVVDTNALELTMRRDPAAK